METKLPESLENELTYLTAKSGGKGGQHVNKVSSKVWVRFNLHQTALLDKEQKERIAERLQNRISKDGVISLSADAERSQLLNKKRATQKMLDMLERAMQPRKKRKRSKVPKSVKENRLNQKKRKSELKKRRGERFNGGEN